MIAQLDKNTQLFLGFFTVYSMHSSIHFAVAEQLPNWAYLIPVETIRKNVCDL